MNPHDPNPRARCSPPVAANVPTPVQITLPMREARPARRFSFSTQLKDVAHRVGEKPIRLDELAAVFQGRTSNVLLILLALPFLTPVPLPLLSVLFGIIIALFGLCMALLRKPWLPARLGDRQLPGGALARILSAAGRVIGWLERLARPRWIYAEHLRVIRRLNGMLIAVAGCLLLLPLPIPFSNLFPAAAVVLLALGGLQRDGLCFLGGCLALLLSLGYFVALALGGGEVVSRFWP